MTNTHVLTGQFKKNVIRTFEEWVISVSVLTHPFHSQGEWFSGNFCLFPMLSFIVLLFSVCILSDILFNCIHLWVSYKLGVQNTWPMCLLGPAKSFVYRGSSKFNKSRNFFNSNINLIFKLMNSVIVEIFPFQLVNCYLSDSPTSGDCLCPNIWCLSLVFCSYTTVHLSVCFSLFLLQSLNFLALCDNIAFKFFISDLIIINKSLR